LTQKRVLLIYSSTASHHNFITLAVRYYAPTLRRALIAKPMTGEPYGYAADRFHRCS
jgi:hypothetical protein